MKVYIVTGNDYPKAVFSKEADADAYCIKATKLQNKNVLMFWRVYEFKVDEHVLTNKHPDTCECAECWQQMEGRR